VNLLECVAEHHGKEFNDWKLSTVLKPRQMNGNIQTQKLCQPVDVTAHHMDKASAKNVPSQTLQSSPNRLNILPYLVDFMKLRHLYYKNRKRLSAMSARIAATF